MVFAAYTSAQESNMTEEIIVPGKAKISYVGNGLIIIKMLPGSVIDLDTARDIVKLTSDIANNELHCNLVDIRNMKYISADAQKHFSRQNHHNIPAIALLIDSRIQKNLANLYFKFTNPMIPTRAFDNEEEAEHYLLQKLKERKGLS
jgi:hypothetical protein